MARKLKYPRYSTTRKGKCKGKRKVKRKNTKSTLRKRQRKNTKYTLRRRRRNKIKRGGVKPVYSKENRYELLEDHHRLGKNGFYNCDMITVQGTSGHSTFYDLVHNGLSGWNINPETISNYLDGDEEVSEEGIPMIPGIFIIYLHEGNYYMNILLQFGSGGQPLKFYDSFNHVSLMESTAFVWYDPSEGRREEPKLWGEHRRQDTITMAGEIFFCGAENDLKKLYSWNAGSGGFRPCKKDVELVREIDTEHNGWSKGKFASLYKPWLTAHDPFSVADCWDKRDYR